MSLKTECFCPNSFILATCHGNFLSFQVLKGYTSLCMLELNYGYHCFYHVHQQIVSEVARQPQDTEMLVLTPW